MGMFDTNFYCVPCEKILARSSFTICDCCDEPVTNSGDCGEICRECEVADDITDTGTVIINYNNKQYLVCEDCNHTGLIVKLLRKMGILSNLF